MTCRLQVPVRRAMHLAHAAGANEHDNFIATEVRARREAHFPRRLDIGGATVLLSYDRWT
jgi:hypothetical protein